MTSSIILVKNALDSEIRFVFFLWKQHPYTLMRRKRAANLCTQPENNPGIQRTVHTNSYLMSYLERK